MVLGEAGAFHLIVLVAVAALFAAAVFRPHIIKSNNASWAAVLFVVLAHVAPGLLLAILAMDGFESRVETVPILSVISQLLLACALISTAIALLPSPQWEKIKSFFVNPTGHNRNPMRNSRRLRLDSECLSCGKNIPAEVSECPSCGWTWDDQIKNE